jgi:hypothetical protein
VWAACWQSSCGSVTYQKPRAEILKHFEDTRAALGASCESFDRGHHWESFRIATAIYAMVHDGGRNSRSILTQLGLRGGLRLSSKVNIRPGNLLADMPLVVFRISQQGPQCLPILDGGPLDGQSQQLQFGKWWEQTILAHSHRGLALSRRDLVFSMRNQDGGAHVDPNLTDEAYVRFSRIHPGTPRFISTTTGEMPFTGIVEACMRHVGWELLQAINALGPIS